MEKINKKIDHIELEINSEGVQIPQFMKNDFTWCASCNTDLWNKFSNEQISKELASINPNKYYFWELKDKAGKFGVGYSQALNCIWSET